MIKKLITFCFLISFTTLAYATGDIELIAKIKPYGNAFQDIADAANIGIADSGSYFTSTQVEGALQEIGASLASTGLTIGTTAIASGHAGAMLYENASHELDEDYTRLFYDPTTYTFTVDSPASASQWADIVCSWSYYSTSIRLTHGSTLEGSGNSFFDTDAGNISLRPNGGPFSSHITTFSGSDGSISFQGSTLTTNATELLLKETGDTFGSMTLHLQNRTGVNGALFENSSSGAAKGLVDFVFKPDYNSSTTQRNIRLEGRSGNFFSEIDEFEIGIPANPSLLITDNYVATRRALGINVMAPSTAIQIVGTSAQTISEARNGNSNTAGQSLTLDAGGATTGATNKNGGDLIEKSGISTGSGTSAIRLFVSPGGAGSTSDNTRIEALTILGDSTIATAAKIGIRGAVGTWDGGIDSAIYLHGTWPSITFDASTKWTISQSAVDGSIIFWDDTYFSNQAFEFGTGSSQATLYIGTKGTDGTMALAAPYAGSGEVPAGGFFGGTGTGSFTFISSGAGGGGDPTGAKLVGCYYVVSTNTYRSAYEVSNVASGFSNLSLMRSGGTVGVALGTSSSTAFLQIHAPTTALASLRLTASSAVDVSSPNAGDLWFNGTNLYFYNGSSNTDLLAGGGGITIGDAIGSSTAFTNLYVDGSGNLANSADIALSGQAARTWGLNRNTTSNTAGVGLTLNTGGATSGATNKAGGDFNFKAGIATGSGESKMHWFVSPANGGGGSTLDNTLVEYMTLSTNLLNIAGTMRATSFATPATGSGVEVLFDGTNGIINSYNRTGSSYLPFQLNTQAMTLTSNSSGLNIVSANTDPISFKINSATAMTIKPGGVGIGNTNPLVTLDSGGTIRAVGQSTPTGGVGTEMYYLSGSGFLIAFDRTGGTFQPLAIYGDPISLMQGNVGVNDLSPGSKLVVKSTTSSGTAFTAQITDTAGSTNKAVVGTTLSTSGNSYASFFQSLGAGSVNYGSYFKASGASTNYAFVTDGGNVGIGTLNPPKLFCVGSGNLTCMDSNGIFTTYNSETVLGNGVASIQSYRRATNGQTGSTSLTAYTVGGADESLEITANINVTTATINNFTVTCSYTDETGASIVSTLPFSSVTGSVLNNITNALGTGPFEGLPIHIRAKASTNVTIATTGTFTTVTYNFEGVMKRTA